MRKKLLSILPLLFIAITLCALTSNAKTIKSISQKKWTVLTAYDKSYNTIYYKFKVPSSDLALKIESKNKEDNIGIVDKKFGNDTIYYFNESGYIYLNLKKGTYYFWAYSNNIKIKYSLIKPTNTSNYCIEKAEKLNKKKTIYGFQHLKNNYSRYYKIKLTKKQKITIRKEYPCGIALYDKYCSPVNLIWENEYYEKSSIPLSPGTYYIRVNSMDYEGLLGGSGAFAISWK